MTISSSVVDTVNDSNGVDLSGLDQVESEYQSKLERKREMIRNSKGGHGPLAPVDYHLLSEDCTSEIDSLKKNITSIKNLIDAIHYVAENDNPNTRVVAPGYLVRLEDKDLQTEKIVMRHIIFVNTRINDLYLFKKSEEIGQVSSSSPIGRAIVGKKAAEISMMVTDKGGSRQITILEISLAETD